MDLLHIQESALKYSNAISTIFNLDVVIIDRQYNKIAHTSRNVSNSVKVTRTSVIGEVMNTGEPLIIQNRKMYEICKMCDDAESCNISGLISVPIFLDNSIIGAIALIISNDEKTNIFENIEPAIDFVQSMADLLSAKIKNLSSFEKLKLIKYEREMIINNIEDGLIMFNTEGVASYCNNSFLEFFNFKYDVAGLHFSEIFNHPELEEMYYMSENNELERFYYENKNYNFLGMVSKKTISMNGKLFGYLFIFKSLRYNFGIFNKTLDEGKEIGFHDISSEDKKLKMEIEKAKELAIKDDNIFIYSEEGLEIRDYARAIHNFSDRSNEGFKEIDCKEKPAYILENEMFGTDKNNESLSVGVLSLINRGTILFTNVDRLAPYLQEKLLNIMKTKVYRTSSIGDISINIRFIFHSTRELKPLVQKGLLNEEFYYRIYNNQITIPPLRERQEDVKNIINNYIEYYKIKYSRLRLKFDSEVLQMMYRYSWPRNIIEVDTTINRLISGSIDDLVNVEDVIDSDFYHTDFPNSYNLEDIEKRLIAEMLEEKFNKEEIAERIGISRSTLYRKIHKYNIKD